MAWGSWLVALLALSAFPPHLCGSLELVASSRFWRYIPLHDQPLQLRAGPSFGAEKTDVYLNPQDIFVADQVWVHSDGVHFLRLADGSGWAYDRLPGEGRVCEFMVRKEQP